jgi:hypothetical protein
MGLFNQLHGRRVAPGRELQILKKLPGITLLGGTCIVALSVLVRLLPPEPGVDAAKYIQTVDIFAIAAGVTFLTAVLTAAIGCVVVHVMKGPAYVADAYPVEHADEPADKHGPGKG